MISTVRDTIRELEGVSYCGGCSVLSGVFSNVRDNAWRMLRTMEGVLYCGGVQFFGGCSVLWRMFRTVEGAQYNTSSIIRTG